MPPWDAPRLDGTDIEALRRAEQWRFNRWARVAAWAVSMLVQTTLAAWGSERKVLRRFEYGRMLRQLPGYVPEEWERKGGDE